MKTIHKYTRNKKGEQFILCSKKKANFSESVSWFWKNVNCKKCIKK